MRLGNLAAKRDWGHARDYVEMQWLMLQQEQPEDFVIATGVQYSVREFVDAAAKELGMPIRWEGEGVNEKGYAADGKCIVAVDPRYFRPTEVETLLGDPTKACVKLGWTPQNQKWLRLFEQLSPIYKCSTGGLPNSVRTTRNCSQRLKKLVRWPRHFRRRGRKYAESSGRNVVQSG